MWEGLRDFICDFGASVIEIIYDMFYYLEKTICLWSTAVNLACPYCMWYVTVELYNARGEFKVGGEIFIPVLFIFISNVLRNLTVRRNLGNAIPVPRKRFTKEEGSGEYSIEEDRIQEMILYVADVEEYLSRKGML